MVLSCQKLLSLAVLSGFSCQLQVPRLLDKFRFRDLILYYNIGVPLLRLLIHVDNLPKNDLMLSVIFDELS